MLGFLRRHREVRYRYRACPACDATNWRPGGSGEILERFGRLYVKQYHKCLNCGLRMRLVRKMHSRTWSRTEAEAILTK